MHARTPTSTTVAITQLMANHRIEKTRWTALLTRSVRRYSSRMFEQQSVLRYPTEDTQALWRYVTSERLLDLLTSEELYLTHVLAFSDGLEGSLTNRTRDRLLTWFKTQIKVDEASAQELVRRYKEAQEDFYVSCWHMNDVESYLMWKAYAERGFALRTTYKRSSSCI